jgi:hypothetical protein
MNLHIGNNINYLDSMIHPKLINTILSPTFRLGAYEFPGFYASAVMQFEPTLKIHSPGVFEINPNDRTNSVFGFRYVRNQNDTANGMLNFRQSQGYTDSIVLADNWPDDEIYGNTGSWSGGFYNGINWNLSLNLKRLNLQSDTLKNYDSVLVIKLKYYTNTNDSGFIKFSKLPLAGNLLSLNHYQNRGHALLTDTMPDTQLVISKDMLLNLTDSIQGRGPEITISAHFICDGNIIV